MNLKSFGCSFIYGTDLSDVGTDSAQSQPSQLTWPALLSQDLGMTYQCYARGGTGNLQILENIIHQVSVDPKSKYVIGWTWIERFDYVDVVQQPECWKTIRATSTELSAQAYYKYLHSELRDKLTTLIYIKTAVDILTANNCDFVMTYIDDLMFDQQWHAPDSVKYLQEQIRPYMTTFEGKTFLDWSRAQGFDVSATLHPLETAHQAAAKLMRPHLNHFLL